MTQQSDSTPGSQPGSRTATETSGGHHLNVDEVVDGARLSSYHFVVLALCGGILLVDGFNVAVLGYITPLILDEWQVDTIAFGPILSASLAGNFVGFLVTPPLSYRHGHKLIAVLSVALFGFFEVLAGLSPGPVMLGVCRFFAGIGLSGALISSVAIIGELAPKRWRSTAVTYIFIGNTVGQMIAGQMTSILTSMGLNWRSVLIFGGAASLAYVLVIVRFLPNSLEYLINRTRRQDEARKILSRIGGEPIGEETRLTAEEPRDKAASPGRLFASEWRVATIMLWVAMGMNALVVGSFYGWLTTLLVRSGISQPDAVSMVVAITAAGIFSGLLVGPFMDMVGPFRAVAVLFFTAAASVLLLGHVVTLGVLLLATSTAFMANLCMNGLSKGAAAVAVSIYPASLRGTGIGWMLAVSRLGAIFGPMVVGALLQYGWTASMVFEAAAGPLVLGGLAILVGSRYLNKEDADAAEGHGR